MSRFAVALAAAGLLAGGAAAHPLPNLRFDRAAVVRLSPDAVGVEYTLELTDWTLVLDARDVLPAADLAGFAGRVPFAHKYAARKAVLLADNLHATLGGADLAFRPGEPAVEADGDHLRLRFPFRAEWRPAPGAAHLFAFEDGNFEDRPGTVGVTLEAAGVTLSDVREAADLRGRSSLDLKPGDERRLRRAAATVSVPATPTSPPDAPPPPRAGPGAAPTAVGTDLANRGLVAVFDTGYGLLGLLGLAFLFGMAHAFTPGHGKVMVAAYLVGERGTVWHALALGLTTTAAHTGSVLAVAAVLQVAYGDAVPRTTEAVLKLAGGLLVAGVGAWLFVQRLRGRADHVHLPAGAVGRGGIVRVLMLGLGAGLVPCWDAVLLLLVSVSAGRLGTAVPLLVAFSGGLATVLVALGIGVVLARRAGGRRFADAWWFRALPVVSAAALILMGVWFARAGAQGLGGPPAGATGGRKP